MPFTQHSCDVKATQVTVSLRIQNLLHWAQDDSAHMVFNRNPSLGWLIVANKAIQPVFGALSLPAIPALIRQSKKVIQTLCGCGFFLIPFAKLFWWRLIWANHHAN